MADERTRLAKGVEVSLGRWFVEHRLAVLLAYFLVLLAVFLVLAINTPEGQRWLAEGQTKWHAYQAYRRFQQALAQDPPRGFALAQLGNRQKALLLIVTGDCGGCEAPTVQEWAETLGAWKTWRGELTGMLVFRDNAQQVADAAAEGNWRVPAITDEDGAIARALNAVFTPRAYGFVDGKLVWLQKEPKMGVVKVMENFLKAAKGEGQAKALLNAWLAEVREKTGDKAAANPVSGRGKP